VEFRHGEVRCCLSHWSRADKAATGRTGVNARLMAPEVLERAKVVPLNGASI
jgi:hypothetical protein